jgi:NH3-dependent NAD+ synthetase
MGVSNLTGALLLTTGNKTEMAVGYATLYGDACGGYNPFKDLWKTEVFAVCRWRNVLAGAGAAALGLIGPAAPGLGAILARTPTAEIGSAERHGTCEDQLTLEERAVCLRAVSAIGCVPLRCFVVLSRSFFGA